VGHSAVHASLPHHRRDDSDDGSRTGPDLRPLQRHRALQGASAPGLAACAPYFHNGSAATLEDVIDHYEQRFGFVFVGADKADLVAFLRAL